MIPQLGNRPFRGGFVQIRSLWVVPSPLMAISFKSFRRPAWSPEGPGPVLRDWYPKWTRWPNWLLCNWPLGRAIAEVLGSAVALTCHHNTSHFLAVIITAGTFAAAGASTVRHAGDRVRVWC